MAAPVKIEISDVIDRSTISTFQMGIFVLCCVCLFIVGFDWQALGYVAPAIAQDFKIPNAALGPVFGAANVVHDALRPARSERSESNGPR